MARMLKFSLQMAWPILLTIVAQTAWIAARFTTLENHVEYLQTDQDKIDVRLQTIESRMWGRQ